MTPNQNALFSQIPVGGQATWLPTHFAVDLDAFQDVVAVLSEMEDEGLIEVLELHRESTTTRRLIDLVRFKRLR